jgi:hypothetical protein
MQHGLEQRLLDRLLERARANMNSLSLAHSSSTQAVITRLALRMSCRCRAQPPLSLSLHWSDCSSQQAEAVFADAARIQLRYLQQDPFSWAHSGLDAIIVRALEDDDGDRDREIERSYGVPAMVAPFVTGTAVSLG